MKKLLVVLLCAATFGASAQDFSWGPTPIDTAGGTSADFEITSTSYFRNFGDDTTFVWHRVLSLPGNWANTVCDINQCYGEKVDSAQFILPKGDSFNMKANFYPNNEDGLGCIMLTVTSLTDRSKKVVKQFCAGTLLSTGTFEDVFENGFALYPNPAASTINVNVVKSGSYDIQILDMVGREMRTIRDLNGIQTLDISALPIGVYNMRVVQDGSISVKSFVKQF